MSLMPLVAAGTRSSRAIEIVSEGATFAPRIAVTLGARVQWTFADGGRSTSLTPSVDYGTAASRVNRLRVSPGGLLAINLGYDGSDGGGTSMVARTYAVLHAIQSVSAVRNLSVARDSLVWWSSAQNPELRELDFSGFASLERVDCFCADARGGLTTFHVEGCTSLRRLCVEGHQITHSLDLREAPIEDIRASHNSFPTILWGNTSRLWHVCIRRIPALAADGFPPISAMPEIREFFVQATGRTGVYDLTNGFPAGRAGNVWLYDNAITGILLTGCGGLIELHANDNPLTQAAVDSVLSQLVALGAVGGYLNLEETTAPSAAGLADVATLTGRGWTVTVTVDP